MGRAGRILEEHSPVHLLNLTVLNSDVARGYMPVVWFVLVMLGTYLRVH